MKHEEEYPYTEETIMTEHARITICRPILPPEERERRQNRIRQAMLRLYEHCLENGIPWPGDPGYDEYVAEQNRLKEEAKQKPKNQKAV